MNSKTNQIVAVAAAAGALGAGIGIGQNLAGDRQAPRAGVVWAQGGGTVRGMEERNIIRVAKEVRPAVVSVSRGRGSGSGVIISENGVILTNAHVVGTADTVRVQLADGRQPQGRVVGRDPSVDIAVVKIDAQNLPKADVADSDQLEIGQAAIAIGNPLGLDRTVTTGVVSAVSRRIDEGNSEGFIQTDAAINPGNSGGPLLDSSGRVIGINSQILTGPGGGLGFAVPINVARDAANQILATGRVQRVRLGVSYNDVDPDTAEAFNLPVSQGVVVAEVTEGSAAERAGIRAQDIITRVDETPIRGGGDLRRALRGRKPGDTVAVTLRRGNGGGTRTVDVRLSAAPQTRERERR